MNKAKIKEIVRKRLGTYKTIYIGHPVEVLMNEFIAKKTVDAMIDDLSQLQLTQSDAVDNTCNLIRDKNEWPECILTDCCGIGPITYENYCSSCGKKIIK